MDERDVAHRVIALLAEELGCPPGAIAGEHALVEDLGLDSLHAVRVLAGLEEELGVELVSTDYVTARRVADLIALVVRDVGAQRSGG